MTRTLRVLLTVALGLALHSAHAAAAEVAAPSPFPVLQPRALTPPLLDVAPVCLPGAERASFGPALERLRNGDVEGARHKLRGLAAEFGIEERQDADLADAVLAARASGDPTTSRAALRDALERNPSAASRACARIELARLAIRKRLLPEARAELGRVARELADTRPPDGSELTSRFYAAEIAVLEGRRETAAAAYAQLAEVSRPWLSRAARLRRADLAIAWPVPDPAETTRGAWRRLATALDEARSAEIDVAAWSPRAAEIAIAAGELEAAHRWLADAERIESGSGVASIRKADVLVALDRAADARKVLDRVASSGTLRAARDLANVRRAGYGVGGESTQQRVERLRRGAASLHPHVAAYARFELARVQLTDGDVTSTLESLARLAYTGALPGVEEGLAGVLDRAVRAAAPEGTPCAAVLERLGGRRNLFIGLSNEPGPFLRLGDCFLELEMPRQALDVYRQLARRFGTDETLGLPLRMARASFAAGDLPILRATLRAYFSAPENADASGARSADGTHWRWLRARLDLHDGEVGRAALTLEQLALGGAMPERVRVGVERELARLPDGALPARRIGVALATSLAKPAGEPAARAEAWLRLADLQRAEGRGTIARAAYRRAAELLPPGSRRTRALFAAGLLTTDANQIPGSLKEARNAAPTLHWARLADSEARLIALRAAARGEVLGP